MKLGLKLTFLFITVGLTVLMINDRQIFNDQHHEKQTKFQNWKIKYAIQYSSEAQHYYRQKIFIKNVGQIQKHNLNIKKTYTQGINQFTDLTQQQFVQIYLGLLPQQKQKKIQSIMDKIQDQKNYLQNLKLDVDWRTRGAVTPVKDQGKCGSCWAFSTTGGLQGFYKLTKGSLLSFSQQQLLDCSNGYGNMGCNGGLMSHAYSYVKDKGIAIQSDYPYIAVQQKCQKQGGSFRIGGHNSPYSCNQLATTITRLPISVGVDATNWSKYSSGVFGDCGRNMNHGVTLIGLSEGNWVIKNSWGSTWGQSGYIRLTPGNTCGICDTASYPTH